MSECSNLTQPSLTGEGKTNLSFLKIESVLLRSFEKEEVHIFTIRKSEMCAQR